ncbi:MAG: CoA transferase [Rhizobiaceae bacterium]|nr:CoA transferase [Rhizobiaceae bacterium]
MEEPTGHQAALAGLRVVDLSTSVAGQYAARLFADYGADVVLVEPSSGSPIRRQPPFRADGGESLLFWHLNLGKRTATLDIDTAEGMESLKRMTSDADVVLTTDPQLARRLRAANRRLVICATPDFSEDGPYRDWVGSEMVHQALGGLMYMTGRPPAEPLYGFGYRAYYGTGAAAYSATLAALIARKRTGEGEIVTVDVHQTSTSMSQNLVAQFSYNGSYPARGEYPGACDVFSANDGWFVIFCGGRRWRAFCSALGFEDLKVEPLFATPDLLMRNWQEAYRRLAPRFKQMSVDEVVEKIESSGANASRVLSPTEVYACPHLASRNYWQTVQTAEGPRIALGAPFRMEKTPRLAPRHVPGAVGSIDAPEWPVRGAKTVEHAAPVMGGAPLAGKRVLEFTAAWAGPMLGRMLAHLGAEVIKVESLDRMDTWRGVITGGERIRYPDGIEGERPYNRNVWYNSQNHNKLSLDLDLKAPAARDIILGLQADVVISNFRVGVLDRLGIGYADFQKARPDIIFLEMPAYGKGDSPLARASGVGPTMEALAGFTALSGYGDGVPCRSGSAYADPIGALNGLSAVMTALFAREQGFGGQRVELAQREGLMQYDGEWLLEAIDKGVNPLPQGNSIADAAPHDAFRTQGDENQWIAIAAFDEKQWHSLVTVLGATSLLDDQRFASRAERLLHRSALRAELEKHTIQHDKHELATALQQAKVPAAPVCSGEDVFNDPHLNATGFIFEVDQPEVGIYKYHGLPFDFETSRNAKWKPSPLLGQHNELLLKRLRPARKAGDGQASAQDRESAAQEAMQ